MKRKFAWWPLPLSEYNGRFWKYTETRAWLEWVRVVETVWGDTMYVAQAAGGGEWVAHNGDAASGKMVECGGCAPPVYVDAAPDANVEAVRVRMLERSRVGLVKYGVTTERGDLTREQWLRHLQEELMDACIYIEAAINNERP